MLGHNRRTYVILATLLLCVAGSVLAAQTRPTGTWSGVLRNDKSARVPTETSFDGKVAHLHFNEPANCRVDAAYIETDSDGSHYAFKPTTNGGRFCQQLYPGNLVATTTDDGVILSLLQGDTHWHGTLKPDSP
jgi:hypothetical protein